MSQYNYDIDLSEFLDYKTEASDTRLSELCKKYSLHLRAASVQAWVRQQHNSDLQFLQPHLNVASGSPVEELIEFCNVCKDEGNLYLVTALVTTADLIDQEIVCTHNTVLSDALLQGSVVILGEVPTGPSTIIHKTFKGDSKIKSHQVSAYLNGDVTPTVITTDKIGEFNLLAGSCAIRGGVDAGRPIFPSGKMKQTYNTKTLVVADAIAYLFYIENEVVKSSFGTTNSQRVYKNLNRNALQVFFLRISSIWASFQSRQNPRIKYLIGTKLADIFVTMFAGFPALGCALYEPLLKIFEFTDRMVESKVINYESQEHTFTFPKCNPVPVGYVSRNYGVVMEFKGQCMTVGKSIIGAHAYLHDSRLARGNNESGASGLSLGYFYGFSLRRDIIDMMNWFNLIMSYDFSSYSSIFISPTSNWTLQGILYGLKVQKCNASIYVYNSNFSTGSYAVDFISIGAASFFEALGALELDDDTTICDIQCNLQSMYADVDQQSEEFINARIENRDRMLARVLARKSSSIRPVALTPSLMKMGFYYKRTAEPHNLIIIAAHNMKDRECGLWWKSFKGSMIIDEFLWYAIMANAVRNNSVFFCDEFAAYCDFNKRVVPTFLNIIPPRIGKEKFMDLTGGTDFNIIDTVNFAHRRDNFGDDAPKNNGGGRGVKGRGRGGGRGEKPDKPLIDNRKPKGKWAEKGKSNRDPEKATAVKNQEKFSEKVIAVKNQEVRTKSTANESKFQPKSPPLSKKEHVSLENVKDIPPKPNLSDLLNSFPSKVKLGADIPDASNANDLY